MLRRNLMINEKLKVIDEIKNDKYTVKDIQKVFQVSRSSVYRYLCEKNELTDAKENGLGRRTRLDKSVNRSNHDQRVKDWVIMCQEKGLPLTRSMICYQVKTIALELQLDLECTSGWFDQFKNRTHLKLGKISGEVKAVNVNVVAHWKEIEIPKLLINWQDDFIFNCDETGLFWRQTPSKSYFISKLEHNGDKIFKERISILFCCNRSGQKLKPLVIGKSAKPRFFSANSLANLNLN